MSKRFTATDKWAKEWFQGLSPRLKCLWQYMCDSCDAAGVWEPNFRMATFVIGEPISKEDLSAFGDRIEALPCGKVWIVAFIEFQYGNLSRDTRAHNPVFASIQKHRLNEIERVPIPFGRVMERDKDKDKDKDKKEGCGEEPTVEEVCTEGEMRGVPKDFCQHYHENKLIKRTWFNSHGILIDWKRELLKWWAGDRHRWTNGSNGNGFHREANPEISTHPANPEWVGYDKRKVTTEMQKEFENLKRKAVGQK